MCVIFFVRQFLPWFWKMGRAENFSKNRLSINKASWWFLDLENEDRFFRPFDFLLYLKTNIYIYTLLRKKRDDKSRGWSQNCWARQCKINPQFGVKSGVHLHFFHEHIISMSLFITVLARCCLFACCLWGNNLGLKVHTRNNENEKEKTQTYTAVAHVRVRKVVSRT